jgi:hypothetical protein
MATFRITSQNFQRTDSGPRFNGDRVQARRELVRIAAGLRTANGRGVIQGYLRLTNGAGNQLTLGKNLLWSRSGANMAAKDLVADMVAKAYGDHAEVQQALTDYLARSDQRVGTQSFVKLVKALDGLDDTAEAAPKDPQIEADRLVLRQMQPAQTAKLRTDQLAPRKNEGASSPAVMQPIQADPVKARYLSVIKHAIDADGVRR